MAQPTSTSTSTPAPPHKTTYTQAHTTSALAAHATRTADTLCQYLLPHLHSFHATSHPTLLDIGCGPGSITTSFCAHLPRGAQITGLDAGEDAVASANARADKPANVRFEVGDAFALRWADATFDVVHANYTLMHVAEPAAVLREMRRVCKSEGGVVAAREACFSSMILHPCNGVLEKWKAVSLGAFRAAGNRPDAGKELVALCLDAGFAAEQVRFTSENMTYTNAKKGDGAGMLEWWAENAVRRLREDTAWRERVVKEGLCEEGEFEGFERAWEEMARMRGGVYSVWCGCVIAEK